MSIPYRKILFILTAAGLFIAALLSGLATMQSALAGPASRAPQAPRLLTTADDSYTTPEDTPLSVVAPGVLSNDGTNAENATLLTDTLHGTLVLNTDGSFTYTPTLNYNGPDEFFYESTNITGTFSYTATIDITPVNDPPVGVNDSYYMLQGTVLTRTAPGVLGNDTDVDSPVLTATVDTGPTHGLLDLAVDGSFTYTPTSTYAGLDSFTYLVEDDQSASDQATVDIIVNDPPTVQDDLANPQEDAAVLIPVLDNDFDDNTFDSFDGLDTSTLAVIIDGFRGSAVVNPGTPPDILYIPDPNQNGIDFVDYEVCDNYGVCRSATITITINPVNDKPIANPDSYGMLKNSTLSVNTVQGVLANDEDIDGPTLQVYLTQTPVPSTGSLTLRFDGSFDYTPPLDFTGTATFQYRAFDGLENSEASATVTITVSDSVPPVANPDSYSTAEDTLLDVAASGVLSNDSDPDGSPLTAVLNSPPQHGTLNLRADGSFTYQPDANYHGPDSFSYQADDGYGLSPAAVVSLTVTSVNDAPAAVDDSYLLNVETASDPGGNLIVAAPGVLANDTDVDTGDTLTAALAPVDSNVQLQPDGSFVFTPPSGYVGTYTFTYQVSDGHTSTTATVSIQVDTQAPDVQWLLPAGLEGGGAIFPASPLGDTITLEFSVADNSPLNSVSLKIWDTTILDYIVFQTYPAAPYSKTFHTDDLPNIGYNQLRVYAYDTAGNLGTSYVFIYRPYMKIHFPVIAK